MLMNHCRLPAPYIMRTQFSNWSCLPSTTRGVPRHLKCTFRAHRNSRIYRIMLLYTLLAVSICNFYLAEAKKTSSELSLNKPRPSPQITIRQASYNALDRRSNRQSRPIIVIVAHGASVQDAWLDDTIRTITPASETLFCNQVISYIRTPSALLYPSSSIGPLSGLTDAECASYFPRMAAWNRRYRLQFTNERLGGSQHGAPVFVLKGGRMQLVELRIMVTRDFPNSNIIMLACRN